MEPDVSTWGALLAQAHEANEHATFLGKSARDWRELTRRELNIPTGQAVIATGHEAVLWHPGILAKYLAMNAWAQHCGAACVHLVVDQHTGGFGSFEIPNLNDQGELTLLNIQLGAVKDDVPMGWHPPLNPPAFPRHFSPSLPSVDDGAHCIVELVEEHKDAANAAAQMSAVLDALLTPWLKPLPGVTATMLMHTTLARAFVQAMVDDPQTTVKHYNSAVAQVPEAGIGPLAVAPGMVELPLWRIDSDGVRKRAFVTDAKVWLDDPTKFALLPRALTMTALMRLGMCDVFIHGFGGAQYDPAMEKWIAAWLSATPQPIVMVSATMRLPLSLGARPQRDVQAAQQRARHLWHDPAAQEHAHSPSDWKTKWMAKIAASPRNSVERRQLYLAMHDALAGERQAHADAVTKAKDDLERAQRQQREKPIVERRTWPFPLYPKAMLDELEQQVTQRVRAGCACGETTSARS